MKEKFKNFIQGRYIAYYGVDALSKFLLLFIIISPILTNSRFKDFIYYFNFVLIAILYFRAFSKNISARYEENQKFLKLISPIRKSFSKISLIIKDRKHKYIKCSICKQELRVPRKKGKIKVKCKKCGNEFIIRT
ncbi:MULTISPECIES: hypothetical protein [Peptoniphilus]|uniref:hypothetical protein n=1 Tax=Peptoniphilus TaxID=162289 RepID=UPI00040E4A1B|nr:MULTISPECIES: hypothetical protein [Peptoniphilus]